MRVVDVASTDDSGHAGIAKSREPPTPGMAEVAREGCRYEFVSAADQLPQRLNMPGDARFRIFG